MSIAATLRTHARRVWRALWPIAVVVGGAVTCDSPMAPKPGMIAIAPQLDLAGLRQFAGMSVDQARILVIRPVSDTIARQTLAFSLDSTHLEASIAVPVTGTESLTVVFELLAGGQVLFTGSQRVAVTAGLETPIPTPVVPTFVGPGSSIASIQIQPRDSGAIFGANVPFRIVALDSSNNPVSSFYAGWSTSNAAHATNAAGVLTAGNSRGVVWIFAHTPTGIRDSTRITISPVPSALQVVSGSGQSAPAGSALPQQLVVRVIAADNGPVVGVPVTFSASGGGSVNPASAVTDTLGLAKTTATLGASVGATTFSAVAPGLAAVTFNQTVTSGTATKLAVTGQPSSVQAGVAINPAVQVAAQDAGGNLVSSFTGPITLALGANPGSGTLGGTLTVNAVNGIATFGNLTVDKAANGYTLAASASGLTGATSSAFNVTAGPAASIALVSGNNQSGAPSAALAQALVVKVADQFGNAVAGRAVTFAVTAGGGTVGSPAATTAANGQASSTWTLGATGAQTATATATGLTGSPVTFTATVSNPGTTTIAPAVDTITAINGTFQFTAQARNQAGQLYAGSFTWTIRNTAIATVNTSGLVTAVANGSTYLVVQDTSGTRDSAQVVVQQRIASINVTPSVRNIYLTTSHTFAATAVDGGGTPMPSQPTFTWSTTASAVATVDQAGKVTGVGLGQAQVRATAGAVQGVALVNVITPITRIAVVVDSAGASATDTFTMVSLGQARRYRAIAHDTLDAVMTGVTFTWSSSFPPVANVGTISGDTTTVTSARNGIVEIRATAQGFTSNPGAKLTVSQVLASISLAAPPSNPTATVGIGGNLSLNAVGKDANNQPIPGGSFTYGSSASSIASVSGNVVTGVANGTANITATSGAITSNPLVVTVGGGSVPLLISFGRDTIAVGRGVNTPVPIYLSTPAAQNLTVNLGAGAYAHWGSSTVTITAGQTSASATLFGDSAGTTTLTAADGSGLGYGSGTAVGKVTANMNLATCCFGINATDVVQTQVLLSDPSPAGGTYVTFNFGTPGIASVSPSPAFIPQGQLAADIQIRGLAGGTTTITPVAVGVNGAAATFTAYPPTLTAGYNFLRLGQGQFEPYNYIQLPTYNNTAVTVSLQSSDTNVVTVPASITIPPGNYYAYYPTTAKGVGSATITFSAPGWTAANSVTVQSTTPAVGICCGGTLYTTTPVQNVTVYAQDSTRSSHYRVNSLVVQLRSSDTTVLKVIDTLVAIAPGQYYNSSARYVPGAAGGTAWIIATASGHKPDSTQYTVLGPPLSLSFNTNYVGAGQEDYYVYVQVPNYTTQPLAVSLASSDSNIAAVPASVTIPSGNYYTYFTVRGKAPGAATIVASAVGYQPDTAAYRVTSPGITACCGYTLNNFSTGSNFTVYATDSLRNGHYRSAPLTVSLVSTDTTVIRIDSSSVTIAAGQYYNSNAHITPVGVGTAKIIMSAAGHTAFDTLTYTVQTPSISLSFNTLTVGRRQYFTPTDLYLQVPDYRQTPLKVTLTHTNPAIDSLTQDSVLIGTGQYYNYFGLAGLGLGVDTIVASAPGYRPDTAFVRITTPRFTNCCMPGSATTTNPPFGMTVYATDSLGNGHWTLDTVVVQATASDTTVIKPGQAFFRIPRGAYYANTTVNVAGPGSASITYSDSAATGYQPTTTGTITITGPVLSLSNSTPMLGMRQRAGGGSYVQVPNTVGVPLVVHLLSTDTRVVTVPDSVTIPAGSYYQYFEVTAMDTVGTIQVQATAAGYGPAAMNVQVTQPKFVLSTNTNAYTTSGAQGVTIYAADQNGNAHYTTDSVTVTLQSSAGTVAAFDSTTVVIPKGQYYVNTPTWSPGVTGTAQLSATDARSAIYRYNSGTANISVSTPPLSLGWGTRYLGIGQYDDYVSVSAPNYQAANLVVSFSHVGTPRAGTFTNLTNNAITQLTVPQGQYYEYFRLAGTSAGTDTLVASATSPQHVPDTAYTIVSQGRMDPSSWPGSIAVGDSVAVTIYARDQNQNTHYLVAATDFNLADAAGKVEFHVGGATVTKVTIPADAYFVTFYIVGKASGTANITISATNYSNYTNTVTVP